MSPFQTDPPSSAEVIEVLRAIVNRWSGDYHCCSENKKTATHGAACPLVAGLLMLARIGQSGGTIPPGGLPWPHDPAVDGPEKPPVPPLPDRTGGISGTDGQGWPSGDRLHTGRDQRGIASEVVPYEAVNWSETPPAGQRGNCVCGSSHFGPGAFRTLREHSDAAAAELCGEAYTTAGGLSLRCINPKGHHGGHDDPPYSWGWRP